MQTAATDLVSLDSENPATREWCVVDREPTSKSGHACLLARRMTERGVGDISLNNNDSSGHGECAADQNVNSDRTDQSIADLISDSKQRGLPDTTPIVLAAEFRRTLVMQGSNGRDQFDDMGGVAGILRIVPAM
jgi:hypothetical protein